MDADGNEIIDATHIGHRNPFRYRGYYYDTIIGFYYLKSRFYDPETGRFLSPDSVEYMDPNTIGGLNLYAYCNNNPVMFSDPEGHMPKWLSTTLKITAGVAIIAGLVVGSVLTGGTLSVVLAGAAIGAGAGFVGGGISGLASGGGLEGFANGALAGAITGAVSGAVAASPLGLGWQMGINAAIGAGNYSLNQLFSGANLTIGGLIAGAATGLIMGRVGGEGWLHGSVGQLLKSDVLLNLSKNFIGNAFEYLGKEFLAKFAIATAVTGFAGGGIVISKVLL